MKFDYKGFEVIVDYVGGETSTRIDSYLRDELTTVLDRLKSTQKRVLHINITSIENSRAERHQSADSGASTATPAAGKKTTKKKRRIFG